VVHEEHIEKITKIMGDIIGTSLSEQLQAEVFDDSVNQEQLEQLVTLLQDTVVSAAEARLRSMV
jgi:dephospho-CoA kinase